MALTAEQWQALITTELGGLTLVADNVALYWELHAGYTDDAVRAQYTKLAALDLLIGRAAHQVSFKALDGSSVSLSDIFEHLLRLRALLLAQIDAGIDMGSGGGALGELTTTAPIMPAAGELDPNAQIYRGDALWRRWP